MKYYEIGNIQASIQKLQNGLDALYEVQIVEQNKSYADGKARFRYFFKNHAAALNEILSFAEIDKDDFDVR